VADPHVLPGGWRAPARDLNRLRQSFNGRGRATTCEPDLITTPPRREPQPPAQSDGVPLRGVDEPDPRDVIDRLLKERR